MAIAGTVRDFLEKSGIKYALVAHSHSESSQQTPQAAHVPPSQLAKAVVLDDGLVRLPHIYLEAGDHEELVQIDGGQFVGLMKEAQHGQFSH